MHIASQVEYTISLTVRSPSRNEKASDRNEFPVAKNLKQKLKYSSDHFYYLQVNYANNDGLKLGIIFARLLTYEKPKVGKGHQN